MDIKNAKIKVLDCTVRDGGYLNSWNFDSKVVRECYRALSKAGVDYVELGYRGTEKYFSKDDFGLWRFSPEEAVSEATANIKGAKVALMADFGRSDLDDFLPASESAVTLVRVAAQRDGLKEAVRFIDGLKKKGYETSLNAMGYTNMTALEREELARMLKGSAVDYIYLADSYGSIFPYQIEGLVEPIRDVEGVELGFHPHNSLMMAFANTLEAVRCGVTVVDSSIYGMGRGAGNLNTEILLAYLEGELGGRFNSIPVLNIIDRYFTDFHRDTAWGYKLPIMLSGMFRCHPNYAKALVDAKEYTIEDIWKAMEYIRKKNPVGFSRELLDEVIAGGVIGGLSEEARSGVSSSKVHCARVSGGDSALGVGAAGSPVTYLDRHRDRDFLVLATGPSLKKYKDKIDEFIKKYDPVILGANNLDGLFVPDYHAFNNKRRFMKYVDTVSADSKLLIGEYIPDEMVCEYTEREYESIRYVDILDADFAVEGGVVQANCRTISVLLMGVAIAMGAKRVFAAGMDGYVGAPTADELHFYKEGEEKEDEHMLVDIHKWCQRFIGQIDDHLVDSGHEGVIVLTPTSYKSYYKGIENYI